MVKLSRLNIAGAVLVLAPHFVGSLLYAQSSQPASTATVAANATRAVVTIRTYDSTGKLLGLGSGFLAPDGRVVTNAHVLGGAANAEVIGSDGQLLLASQYAEMLSSRVDVAILPRPSAVPGTLALSNAAIVVGERIVVIGAPEGLTNTVSDGIVSSLRRLDARALIQITAPISHGSSGGPVLNTRSQVVGISVAMLKDGQNLNFAVSASDIRALLRSPPGHYPFPPAESESAAEVPSGSRSQPSEQRVAAPASPAPDPLTYVASLAVLDSFPVGRTEIRFLGCKRVVVSGSADGVCFFRIANTETSESSRLWIFGATLADESGLTAQADVLYFIQTGDQSGFTANWNLAAGQQDLIAIHFKGVPGGRGREGRVVVRASAGWTGGTREAHFSNAFALDDK